MCTCISWQSGPHCFGRTLDLDVSYGETVVITPRRFPLPFRRAGTLYTHHALVGMAHVAEGFPLYYDAMNEHGLCMAGLNFPGSAVYRPEAEGLDNIAPFEVIPWVLSQCRSVSEARALLSHINIEDIAFSDRLPAAPLHWMLADASDCLVLEAMADGLHMLDNPVRVLTNNPPLPAQLARLADYARLTNAAPDAAACEGLGFGSAGLPGDFTSPARFVRAALLRQWAAEPDGEHAVTQFLQLLGAVSIPCGAVLTPEGRTHYTRYASCCTDGGYYYTTPESWRISAVYLNHAELDGDALSVFPLQADSSPLCRN